MGAVRYGANHRTFAVRKEDGMLPLPSLESMQKAQAGLSVIVEVLKAGKPLDEAASKIMVEKLDAVADLIMPPVDPVQPAAGTLAEITASGTQTPQALIAKVRKDLEALSTQAMGTDYMIADHVDAVLEQVKQAETLLAAPAAAPAAAPVVVTPAADAPVAAAPAPAAAPADAAPAPTPATPAPAPAADAQPTTPVAAAPVAAAPVDASIAAAALAPAPASAPAAEVAPAASAAPAPNTPAAVMPATPAPQAEPAPAPAAPVQAAKGDSSALAAQIPVLVAKDMGPAGVAVEDALSGIHQAVRDYWDAKTPAEPDCCYKPSPWIRATYKDHVVIEFQGKFWQHSWTYENGKYAVGEPIEVIQTYVAVAPPVGGAAVVKAETSWMPAPAAVPAPAATPAASAAPAPVDAAKACAASDDEKKHMTKEDVQSIVKEATSGIADGLAALKSMIEGLKAAPAAPAPATVAKQAGAMPSLSGLAPQATQIAPAPVARPSAEAAMSAIESMDLTLSPDLARINDYGVLSPKA